MPIMTRGTIRIHTGIATTGILITIIIIVLITVTAVTEAVTTMATNMVTTTAITVSLPPEQAMDDTIPAADLLIQEQGATEARTPVDLPTQEANPIIPQVAPKARLLPRSKGVHLPTHQRIQEDKVLPNRKAVVVIQARIHGDLQQLKQHAPSIRLQALTTATIADRALLPGLPV